MIRQLDMKLTWSAEWYKMCMDDVPITQFEPRLVVVRRYEWSAPVQWWPTTTRRRAKSASSPAPAASGADGEADEAYMGPEDEGCDEDESLFGSDGDGSEVDAAEECDLDLLTSTYR